MTPARSIPFSWAMPFLTLVTGTVAAATPEEIVGATMLKLAPQIKVDVVQEASAPGFYEAIVGSQFVYVSKDGRFVFDGSVFDASNARDMTEVARAKQRQATLARIGVDKRIIYGPAKPKHRVIVFTDIDCPFCRRFHQQMERYNELGITVEYVFMPLDSHPDAARKSMAVWCAQDRKAALTAAMNGADVGNDTACANPVAETGRLSREMGITHTPTVLAADGTRVSPQAAMVPDQLLAELDRLAQAPVATK
ncbi:MAG TPA: DsbC family protein [Dokdonella sp.]|uniref:DsbC family protein n=1 Tax=Dokdonella sp. TaxID=2291710 RepID=UPI0025C3046F|nr:DsbC family protein [Dokdonella sp.]MBX3690819.1 DsbC family protein [Dokdonella sp.]MCW5568689.1 DsbC family protein [Dokdonella sp.]HNR92196.1 DsbC family protein [Dokdonella sp.]